MKCHEHGFKCVTITFGPVSATDHDPRCPNHPDPVKSAFIRDKAERAAMKTASELYRVARKLAPETLSSADDVEAFLREQLARLVVVRRGLR